MTDLDTILPELESAIVEEDVSMYDIAQKHGAFFATGANMSALVFPDVVVKWVRGETPYHAASGDDENFICNIPTYDRKHFPDTMRMGRFIIQDRVYPIAGMTHVPEAVKTIDFYAQVVRLAYHYGLTDLHNANIGIRSTEDPTPVIFDVSGRKDVQESLRQEMRYENDSVAAWCRVIGWLNLDLWSLLPDGTYDYGRMAELRNELAVKVMDII